METRDAYDGRDAEVGSYKGEKIELQRNINCCKAAY
jgi:hypothetical protein